MKILWVINFLLPEIRDDGKKMLSGGWITTSLKELHKFENNDIHVLCYEKSRTKKTIALNGITYHTINNCNIHKEVYNPKKVMKNCMDIISEINPDIIHIHGTEYPTGLYFLNLKKDIPIVFSIQGLISAINDKGYFWGGIKYNTLSSLFSINKLLEYLPLLLRNKKNKTRSKYEKIILKTAENIIGRTEWDKSYAIALNPNVKYYKDWRVIRESFNYHNWNINNIKKYSIFLAGGASSPLKSAHCIFQAVQLLKKKFPTIKVYIPGRNPYKSLKIGYNLYLINQIKKLNLKDNIIFMGPLSEKEMAKKFSESHCYVMTSCIENSPNTLGEAMTVGVPSIASFVGGVSSMADDKKDILMYRFGEIETIAYKIEKIFVNNDLAIKLSANSKIRAKKNHPKSTAGARLVEIYSDIIKKKD